MVVERDGVGGKSLAVLGSLDQIEVAREEREGGVDKSKEDRR